MSDLATLNRLRVNAGKTELASWKASKAKLADAIQTLRDAGFIDVVAGASLDAKPITTDPLIAKALVEPEKAPDPVKEDKVVKVKAQLARGLDTDGYAKHSRKAVQDIRQKERGDAKEERKKIKLSEKEKAEIAEESQSRKKPKGEVDAKKDPEKAARQKKHIEDKKAKREKEGKASTKKEVGKDEITVADIARDLDIDPTVARSKLRRHEAKIEKLHTAGQSRWTFPKSAAAEIKKILKGEK